MKPTILAFFQPLQGELRVLTVARAAARAPRCVLVVPGADVLAREIEAVGATFAQSQAAALASLSSELATPAPRSICAVTHAKNSKQLAFVASREKADMWLDAARRAGLSPDMIVPDYAMLPMPATGEVCVARNGDWVVRTPTGGFACQPDLAERLTTGSRLIHVELEQSALDQVRSGAIEGSPNLFAAMPRPSGAKTSRKPVWALAAAAATLVVASSSPWILAVRTNDATRSLRADSEATARKALPGARQIVEPLAQLREAMLPRQHAEDTLSAAAAILEGVARAPGVSLARLDLPEEGPVRVTVTASDLAQLQPLREHIASFGFAATEAPNESRPNNLSVELVVSRAS